MYRAGIFDHHVPAQGKTAVANAAGVAKIDYGKVPQGYAWYIERYSVFCPTAAAVTNVTVVPDAGNPTYDAGYRVDSTANYTTGGGNVVGDAFNAIYVPGGYSLIFYVSGATSGDACTTSIQYSVHQLNPALMMSPEDRMQVQAAHEHTGSPLVHVATAEERAV